MTTIAVLGAGSVGVYFAAHLAAVGQDVVACVRRGFERYQVDSSEAPVEGPAHAVVDPDQISAPVEFVLLCVKAHQTSGTAGWLARLCNADTTVVVVQNGVEGADRAQPLVGRATVLPAVVYCGAELLEPGHIRHYARGTIFTPDEPVAHRLAALFQGSGAELVPTAAFLEEAWRKMSWICQTGMPMRTAISFGEGHRPRLAASACEAASTSRVLLRTERGSGSIFRMASRIEPRMRRTAKLAKLVPRSSSKLSTAWIRPSMP